MNILEMLKKENISIHNGSKTLFYIDFCDNEKWEVIEHISANKYKTLIVTESEEEAVKVFLEV
jgi:hypothetical protein